MLASQLTINVLFIKWTLYKSGKTLEILILSVAPRNNLFSPLFNNNSIKREDNKTIVHKYLLTFIFFFLQPEVQISLHLSQYIFLKYTKINNRNEFFILASVGAHQFEVCSEEKRFWKIPVKNGENLT